MARIREENRSIGRNGDRGNYRDCSCNDKVNFTKRDMLELNDSLLQPEFEVTLTGCPSDTSPGIRTRALQGSIAFRS
jgi:hypothetical protein